MTGEHLVLQIITPDGQSLTETQVGLVVFRRKEMRFELGSEIAVFPRHAPMLIRHYWADYFILEISNPETLEPSKDGEVGEIVVTTLRKEAAPLIRYRTLDLTRLIPGRCACGNILPRHDKILGRSDDMFIFRAVNIYPGQIDHILSNTKGVGSEYQIYLDRKEDGKDYMTIKVERAEGGDPAEDTALTNTIEETIKKQVLVQRKNRNR